MDMRSKAYPALPEGRGLRLVLPRTGDLRFRPQTPSAFAQRLYIHADPRRRLWYARFQLRRKFIVMSTQGDLYAKTGVATFTMSGLPKQNLLSMPRVARGDLVKVLDLVQCSRSEGQHWELALSRWRNGMETWLPLEVVQLYAPNLLQEFYVNSINSWAFHARVQPGNLSAFRTEVELWLFHPEFQKFYERLRQKRAGGSAASRLQQQPGQIPDRVRVKPERPTASVSTSHTPPAPRPIHAAEAESDPSEAVIREFEQRRLERERQEQVDRDRRNQLVQLQQQQQQQLQQQQRLQQRVDEQRRLDRRRKEQERQRQEEEHEQHLQHERQRQKAHEELQRSQKEYQQRLWAQLEREKLAEIQQQERERRQRAKEQEQLRQRLQQDKPQKEHPEHQQTPTHRRPQETTRGQLRRKERQKKSASHSSQGPNERNSTSIWTKGGDDEYIPPEASESEDSNTSADSEVSEDSLNSRPTRKRRRKRLLYSQVEIDDDDDDDDDLPDLSQPPPSERRRNVPQDSSDYDTPVGKAAQSNKRRRRLRQSNPPKENGGKSSHVEVDLTQISDDEDGEADNSVEMLMGTAAIRPEESVKEDSHESGDGKVAAALVDEDDDADADDDMDVEPSIIIGDIRCVCGTTSVGGYRGQWLQCWKEDCGVWEHADCVGFLTSFETHPPPKYLCTRCDPESYLARCVKASHRVLDWLFQCCDSRNSKQLMDLLKGHTGAANLPSDWKNANYENRTLAMHAARNGLVKCLCHLLDERKVDLFATDLQSRNALHHAALGGSVACCRLLLKRDQKLLLRQDLRGCMPFHLMLQSPKVNRLCVPFMRDDFSLVGMGDLDSNFPIHYACQTVNSHTVVICQMIFAAQSSMLQERSSEGLYPLMILCKAAGTAVVRNRGIDAREVCKSAKDVIALMLDIDVFGDCLNQTAPNGWAPLHFAAASGNHELVTHLCNIGLFDVQYAARESDQTALHIAARENHPLCVRALLLEGLNVVAKDTDGWIPMLYAKDAACIQEFMHYKLTKQLSRLHRMLHSSKYQQRGLVRRWQRCIARDPTCFDILNDWCQSDTERIERMEGLLLSNPFLLRLDNKIEYVWRYIIQSIKRSPGQCSIGIENGKSGTEKQPRQKKLAFIFSRGGGCFWKQFVGMGMSLEPGDFRLPIVFSIERGSTNSQGAENREGNLKLVLIRLAAGLLKEVPGLLVRGSSGDLEKSLFSSDKDALPAQLLGFFMLGELVAHFVLFAVPLSGILDFTPAFLRCIGCKGKYRLARDEHWEIAGRSFAAGFEAVLPATLELFHADELRVVFNGPETSLNALQIDWNTAVGWNMCGSEAVIDEDADCAKKWLPRLMSELVEEEQQLFLLFMTGTFQLVNERFFRSEGGSGRITIASYAETDSVFDYDAMHPSMEHKPDILRLPSYSCYDAFKKGVLTVIRHAGQAFLPE